MFEVGFDLLRGTCPIGQAEDDPVFLESLLWNLGSEQRQDVCK